MIALAEYFGVALAISLALTPLCRSVAVRFGIVARPKDDRWHKRPTALFGGIAIAVPTLALGATIRPADGLPILLACGVAIAVFGFADDVLSLKPSTKLIAQISIASVLLFLGYRLSWIESLLGDAMLTIFWIVGVTNALNLLDNMDGLCAGVAAIAGAFLLFAIVADAGAAPSSLYLAGLLGATAGFLVYNTHPASIFMGDTGSLFLGFNLAALTLVARRTAPGGTGLVSVIVAPVLLLLIPIFDTTLVTTIRLLSGRSPSQGGRDHTSHRLVAVGLSERRAVAVLWTLGALGGGISLLIGHFRDWGLLTALLFILAMIIFAVYLARIRVYDGRDFVVLRGEAFTPIAAELMYKRRIAEVLLDLCLIPAAYYTAYRLRFEGSLFAANYHFFLVSLPIVLAAQLLALFVVGGYRGTWRYFGMMDAVVFAKGVVLGTATAVIAILYMYRFENYSRTVFVIYAALLMLLLSGTRGSFRLVGEFVLRRTAAGRRCIIYGTSGASVATIREAFGRDTRLKVIGFADDDPNQRNLRVGGYPVIGNSRALLAMISHDEVDCVVLNALRVDPVLLKDLECTCLEHETELLRLHVHVTRISAAS